MKYTTLVNDKQFEIEILGDGKVLIDGKEHHVDYFSLEESLFSVIQDNKSYEIAIEGNTNDYEVQMLGRLYEAKVLDQRALLLAQRKGGIGGGSGEVHSPMPGLIVDVLVNEGDTVTQGATVVVLESMKMQNELKAPCDGVVESIACEKGQTVNKGDLLVNVESSEE